MSKYRFSTIMFLMMLTIIITLNFSGLAVEWEDYDWKPLLKKGDVKVYAAEIHGHKIMPGSSDIRVGAKSELIPMKIKFQTHDLSSGDLAYFKIVRFSAVGTVEAVLEESSTKRAESAELSGGRVAFRFFLDPEKAQVHPWFTNVSLGAEVYQESTGNEYVAHPNTPCKFNLKY